MSEKAHVTSVESLELFRASLVVYQSKARPTMDQVKSDIFRVKDWLQYDREVYWKTQIRRRSKVLEEAHNALFSAKMSSPVGVPDAEQIAFRRAKRALDEAEAKLRVVRRWIREFEHQVDPLVKKLERLQNFLAADMPMALAYLARTVKTLVEYSGSAFGQTEGLNRAAGSAEDETGAPEVKNPDLDAPSSPENQPDQNPPLKP